MTEKVTKIKDPVAQARGKKGWKTQLEKIKAQLLEEIKNGKEISSTATPSFTPSTGSLIILGLVGIAGIYIFNIKKTPEKTQITEKTPKTYM